jgi:cell division initiation protein
MKLTPLDIRQKRFETSLRGFGRKEVEAFLELLASEFEEVVKENIALKEEHKRLLARLEHHQEREKTLQETMVTAQRISEDVKEAARKEAEIVLASAEHQAEKIVDGAHQKRVQIIEDINELKRQRAQFESQVKSVIDAHHKLLETFRATPEESTRIDDNVSFLAHKKVQGE